MTAKINFVPDEVKTIAAQALLDMESHPQKYVIWQTRQKLYKAFGSFEDRRVLIIRTWLAILAAQKVLPILLEQEPYNSTPLEHITLAIAEISPAIHGSSDISQGRKERHSRRVKEAERVFHTLASQDDLHKNHITPWNTLMAQFAASKSLKESRGWLDVFAACNEGKIQTANADTNPYSETEWVYLTNVGDTAGVAALAFSCNTKPICDPAKNEQFWRWWLNKAIPSAWQLSRFSHISR